MNPIFPKDIKYVDYCVDIALSYSESELSHKFSALISTISSRHPHSVSKPIFAKLYVDEYASLPTNIPDGLWYYFGNRRTLKWSEKYVSEYLLELIEEMKSSYVPFRAFAQIDFEDSMRLRLCQDAMNLIAGRKIDVPCVRRYSKFEKAKRIILSSPKVSI